jgi:hypothetical protein
MEEDDVTLVCINSNSSNSIKTYLPPLNFKFEKEPENEFKPTDINYQIDNNLNELNMHDIINRFNNLGLIISNLKKEIVLFKKILILLSLINLVLLIGILAILITKTNGATSETEIKGDFSEISTLDTLETSTKLIEKDTLKNPAKDSSDSKSTEPNIGLKIKELPKSVSKLNESAIKSSKKQIDTINSNNIKK